MNTLPFSRMLVRRSVNTLPFSRMLVRRSVNTLPFSRMLERTNRKILINDGTPLRRTLQQEAGNLAVVIVGKQPSGQCYTEQSS